MKFVVHDYHNNNSYPVGLFESADGQFIIPRDGHVTRHGITFFMLPREADTEERIKMIRSLHELLKDKFGHGIAAVTCSVSDCTDAEKFELIFKAAKSIDPSIKTVEVIHSHQGVSRKSANADYSVEDMLDKQLIKSIILHAVFPRPEDSAIPRKGWQAYRKTVSALYERASRGEMPPARSLRRTLRHLIGKALH